MHWAARAALVALRSRRVRRLLVGAAVAAVLATVVAVVSFGSLLALLAGGGSTDLAATTVCTGSATTTGAGIAVVPAVLTGRGGAARGPTKVAGLDDEQLSTATQIVAEGQRLHLPDYALVVAVATARQESGIRPLPYGDRDSLGPFQQRAGWGPAAQRVDPTTSARLFYTGGLGGQRGLLAVPGYQHLTVTVAAQTVQASAYPDAYADDEAPARQIVSAVLDRSLSVADTGACSVTTAGGLQPGTRCQPSGLDAEAGLTPSALQVLRCVHAGWPDRITSYAGVGPRAANPSSDHPSGRAVDAMIPGWQTPEGRRLGDDVAGYVQASAAALNVRYIIWNARIWSPDRAGEGWRPYRHPSGATDPTSMHRDHVHVSVLP